MVSLELADSNKKEFLVLLLSKVSACCRMSSAVQAGDSLCGQLQVCARRAHKFGGHGSHNGDDIGSIFRVGSAGSGEGLEDDGKSGLDCSLFEVSTRSDVMRGRGEMGEGEPYRPW